jgi:DNA modification methylase
MAENDYIIPQLREHATPVDDLRVDPANANTHPERNMRAIRDSLAEFGQRQVIVARENGTVIAGNGRLEAARNLGWSHIACVTVDDDDLTAMRYAIADNRSGELSEWDSETLAKTLQAVESEFGSLDGLGFDGNDLGELLDELEPEVDVSDAPDAEIDRAEELREKWQTEEGQLWLIGEHRLLCGDSTISDDVSRLLGDSKPMLMVTDPPYGVDYKPGWRGERLGSKVGRAGEVDNDDRADWREAWSMFPGDVVYCWHADKTAGKVRESLESQGFVIRNLIHWVKSHFVISRGHYNPQHETAAYAVRKGGKAHWRGSQGESTVWEIDLHDDTDMKSHGTQKPLGAMANPMKNHAGDVYDPFCGSGTTMAAAERLGRKCFAMELDPKYVAVILERMSEMGLTPELSED